MLNITGPIQSNLPPPQESSDQFLRVNQRISGEVITVSNEQVVLAVNGVQIVAKMTTPEQLALLMDRRYANFIVKDINNKQITLQLTKPTASAISQKSLTSSSIGLALLEQYGIQVNDGNLMIIQSALNRGLKISPELLNEMRQVLESNPGWGQNEAQLAAAIKSAGLPLTEGSLSLAQASVKDIKANFLSLLEQINIAANRSVQTPQIHEMIRSIQNLLQEILVHGGNSREALLQNLTSSIGGLGSSLENAFAKLLNLEGRNTQPENNNGLLYYLASLRHELGGTNFGGLTASIDRFIEGMRWMHFVNSEPDQSMAKGQWTQLDLPISFGVYSQNRVQQDDVHNLQIRVAHDNGEEDSGGRVNPDYTRLVIQVDLDEYDIIKVDLSIVSHLIGAEITATNKEICSIASEELDELKIGLTNLGYTLKTSKIELGNSILEMDLDESGKSLPSISSVDLGV